MPKEGANVELVRQGVAESSSAYTQRRSEHKTDTRREFGGRELGARLNNNRRLHQIDLVPRCVRASRNKGQHFFGTKTKTPMLCHLKNVSRSSEQKDKRKSENTSTSFSTSVGSAEP